MTVLLKATIPIEAISPNRQEHWAKRYARTKVIRQWVEYYWAKDNPKIELPCVVQLSRISSRQLDNHDNLPASMKPFVDIIASKLIPGLKPGQADSDERIEWQYGQKKGKEKGVEVTIYKKEG